jgi:hypothetical protein
MTQNATIAVFVAATAAAFVPSQSTLLRAQSLSGLHVGEPSSNLSALGPAAASDDYKGMKVRKWLFASKNELSVTVDASGRIAFLESDWGGKDDDPRCDLRGLRFGKTTLSDLRKRFGSNGFGYKHRAPSVETGDGIVMVNSYAVGDLVITFFTKIDRDDYLRAKASPADYAKLDAISIADNTYAQSEWNERVYDPAYKKIEWK